MLTWIWMPKFKGKEGSYCKFFLNTNDPGDNMKDFDEARCWIWLPHKYMRFLIFYLDILYIGSYWANVYLYIPLMMFYGIFSFMRGFYKRVIDEASKGDHEKSADEVKEEEQELMHEASLGDNEKSADEVKEEEQESFDEASKGDNEKGDDEKIKKKKQPTEEPFWKVQ